MKIKAEPTSPQADTNKRKFDAVTVTDVDDDAQMDDLTPPVVKVAKGAKGVKARPAKAASSKMQADVAPVNTRKSSRLHPSENPAKKARVSPLRQTEQPDVLFRRLAANFATIGQTLEEIADTVRLF